jgi:hypothetical protein
MSDGHPVAASENQGSDDHDLTQSTDAARMVLRTNVVNGEPVLRNADGDSLQGTFNAGITQPFTYFLVFRVDTTVTNDDTGRFACDGDDNTNRAIIGKDSDPDPDELGVYAGSWLHGSQPDTDFHYITAVFNGASSQFWLDGVSEASGDAGSKDVDGLTIGANYQGAAGNVDWIGDIAEIIIYDSELSAADRAEVETYLSNKYGSMEYVVP